MEEVKPKHESKVCTPLDLGSSFVGQSAKMTAQCRRVLDFGMVTGVKRMI